MALYRLTFAAGRSSRLLMYVVSAGFLLRAVGGQLLFWISYLGLPVATDLQIGRGFWFFALDGRSYYRIAVTAAHGGVLDIVFLDRSIGSFFHVQVLASFILAFGVSPVSGVLLNLFAYSGAAYLITRWGEKTGNPTPALMANLGLALFPSAVLWSFQPLKDPLFLFLVVALVVLAAEWTASWREEREWSRIAALAGMFWVVLFAIAGIRWYYALIAWGASSAALMLVPLFTRRRAICAVVTILMIAALSRACLYGSGRFLPPIFRDAITLRLESKEARLVSSVAAQIEDARAGFDRAGGATLIKPGQTARAIPSQPPRSVPEKSAADLEPAAGVETGSPATEVVPVQAPANVTRVENQDLPSDLTPGDEDEQEVSANTGWRRVVAGLAAVVLPRSVASALGLVEVRGGRGLWLFAEVDTLVFDIILIAAIAAIVRGTRQSMRSPVFWQIVLMSGVVGFLLLYTVTNFGTLFRHRSMIFIGLILIPLALGVSPFSRRVEDADAGVVGPESEPSPS